MDARRRGGAALAVALALACAAPPGTAHAEQLVRTYAEGEAVPGGLVLDGEAYELSGWEPGGGLGAATRTFERTAYKTVAAADYGGDPAACFDTEMAVEEEGFSGSIALVGARAEVSSSHPERSDYEEAVEFSYITKTELDALPATRRATVAGRELELGKLDVQYVRVPSDPGTEIYSGRAIYGVHEQRDVPDEYKLTATYAGELSRGGDAGHGRRRLRARPAGPRARRRRTRGRAPGRRRGYRSVPQVALRSSRRHRHRRLRGPGLGLRPAAEAGEGDGRGGRREERRGPGGACGRRAPGRRGREWQVFRLGGWQPPWRPSWPHSRWPLRSRARRGRTRRTTSRAR